MNDFFLLERHGPVAHLRLDRPERSNTLAPAFFPALRDAVRALQEAGQARVLVVSSTGAHFSAGLALDGGAAGVDPDDPIAALTDRRDPREGAAREAVGALMQMLDERSARATQGAHASVQRLMACFDVLEQAPFPVICAVQGGCVGAALDLACVCDIRLCSADAYFTAHAGDLGVCTDAGSLQRLGRVLPQGAARELAFAGARLDAARAHELGFVNAVLPDAASLLAYAMALAANVAAQPPQATAAAKLAFRQSGDAGFAAFAPPLPSAVPMAPVQPDGRLRH